MTVQTPEAERAWWDAHTDRSEQYGGDWDDDACLREVEVGILEALPLAGQLRGARVLEIGCGTGRLLVPLARKFRNVYWFGADSSSAMLQNYPVLGNLGFATSDGRTLRNPSLAGPWDAAYSVLLFQHLPPDAVAAYIGEVARVLKPGGRFRFQFAHGDGTDHSFLNHNHAREHVIDWVTEGAGLKLTAVEVGRVFDEWTWVTARKPEEA